MSTSPTITTAAAAAAITTSSNTTTAMPIEPETTMENDTTTRIKPQPLDGSNDADKSHLPVILCLHGGGSTATVFKIQARRLIWCLSTQFRFIFVNAPHEGAPGFGMLPVFASCAPFYRWVTRRWVLGPGDVEKVPRHEVAMVDAVLDDVVARECGGDWAKVVGVMGFSQGARMVPGLLLRQLLWHHHQQQQQQQQNGQDSEQQDCKWKFKFGVMIGGPYCPISLVEGEPKVEDYALLKTIPTVHAWGRDDHVRSGCEQLREVCDGDACFQMDFEGGHHLPLKDGEARDLCDLIRAAWYQGGGTFEVGVGEKY